MNRLPWARLITPITPKISVRPLLIRNSSSPYCRPFSTCANSPEMSIAVSAARARGQAIRQPVPGSASASAAMPTTRFSPERASRR